MAETPEEVARKLALDYGKPGLEHDAWNALASALRAQYVAGLRAAAECSCWDCKRKIRELAEQAKREGTTP